MKTTIDTNKTNSLALHDTNYSLSKLKKKSVNKIRRAYYFVEENMDTYACFMLFDEGLIAKEKVLLYRNYPTGYADTSQFYFLKNSEKIILNKPFANHSDQAINTIPEVYAFLDQRGAIRKLDLCYYDQLGESTTKTSYCFYANKSIPFFCFIEGDQMFNSVYEYRIYFEEDKDSVYVIRSTQKYLDTSPAYWEENPTATKRSENIQAYPSKSRH